MTDLIDRLADKIQFDDCWIWEGAHSGNGYGAANDQYRRTLGAHRVVYEAVVEPVATGMTLDHLCSRKDCVNPDHLEQVSGRMNSQRGRGSTETHCARGHSYEGNERWTVRGRQCYRCALDRMREYRVDAMGGD